MPNYRKYVGARVGSGGDEFVSISLIGLKEKTAQKLI
jgi:hypothetical protein